MNIDFFKYHALQNDFIVVESKTAKLSASKMPGFVMNICHRKSGVGADGVLHLTNKGAGRIAIDVYNADGGWAEKSGNGLRIAGLHKCLSNNTNRDIVFEMGSTLNKVRLVKRTKTGGILSADLGVPKFQSEDVPINVKSKFIINKPLKVGGVNFPVTCLSMGNPHTVLFVEDWDFDWQQLGEEIEKHRLFPNGTNVEFVKVISRNKLGLAEWERGVGATGSSGTGAAAAVAAAVVLGIADRKCRVEFESGALAVNWRKSDNVIELTGPVEYICEGVYDFK